ncbi:MAG: hypothetical protein HY868_05035 [Chloroflexi bacterium]|nr:hypothetical protein [Chloroflexota bacterium]
MERDLGEMAQATLKTWAAQMTITANASNSDREGWDFLLQFPPTLPVAGVPLDLRATRIECFVQVKGIETTRQRKSITLSNWEKLVGSPLPAFFLIIEFGKENDPQHAYLVHVNEEWIAKVLKRLRELPDTEKESLNQHTLDLTWSMADRIDTLNGKGLSTAIRRHIGNDFDKYVQKKKNLREKVGHNADAIFKFTSTGFKSVYDMHEQWMDFAIGLRDSLPVSTFTIEKQVRFGIPAEHIEHQDGMVSITPLGKSVTLLISNTEKSKESRFHAMLYTPTSFDPSGIIPKEQLKVRVVSEIGNFVFRPFANPITFSTTWDIEDVTKPRKLGELANLWRAREIFMNAQSEGVILEIHDDENSPCRLESRGHKLLGNEDLASMATAVDRAWFLARLFDISADTEMPLAQILGQDSNFKTVRDLGDPNIRIASIMTRVIDGDFNTEKEHALIFSRVLHFGKVILAVFIGFAGYPTIANGESGEKILEIRKPNRILLDHKKLEKIDQSEYKQLIQSESERMKSMGYEVSDIAE